METLALPVAQFSLTLGVSSGSALYTPVFAWPFRLSLCFLLTGPLSLPGHPLLFQLRSEVLKQELSCSFLAEVQLEKNDK